MSPFDYLNAINYTKEDLIGDDRDVEKKYNSFIVNRGLSYFQDTVVIANEMNRLHKTDNKMQFDFLKGIIRKRKRFSKWNKAEDEVRLRMVKEYYGYSDQKAMDVMDLLTDSQFERLEAVLSKGGKSAKYK